MTALFLYVAVMIAFLFWIIALYNGLVRQRNQVRNAWAQIDVQLKRRHDLIPNLVEVVKDYMSYEQETLSKVVELRAKAMEAKGVQATAETENQLTGALKSLFAVAESYPDLKTNQSLMKLQEELTSTENQIASAREYYNNSAMRMNNMTEVFPSNLVARMFNFVRETYYPIPEEEKSAVKADLR